MDDGHQRAPEEASRAGRPEAAALDANESHAGVLSLAQVMDVSKFALDGAAGRSYAREKRTVRRGEKKLKATDGRALDFQTGGSRFSRSIDTHPNEWVGSLLIMPCRPSFRFLPSRPQSAFPRSFFFSRSCSLVYLVRRGCLRGKFTRQTTSRRPIQWRRALHFTFKRAYKSN